VQRDLALGEVLPDLGGRRLADPGDLLQPARRRHLLYRLRVLADHAGRLAVAVDAERVLPQDLHEIGDLREDVGDLAVLHGPPA
jgi:hypothetical protein